jgi:RimJ/RimL family protein N-acetyltransferase
VEPLVGTVVVIRPFRPVELETWWRGLRMLDVDAQPAGPPSRASIRRRIERAGRFEDGKVDLAIEVDGRIVGDIQTQRPPGVEFPPGVLQVGIAVFAPDDRGRGYGSEAMELFTGWLFAHQRAERVQAGTALDNVAMRRVLERLGYEVDRPIDVFGQRHLLFAISRSHWEAR